MTCPHCLDAPDLFGPKVALWEMKRYRRRGPSKTTRMLLDALADEGAEGYSLLDIGGGVGAIQHEMLADGSTRVVNVDASPAYQDVVREEAKKRGTADRIAFHMGDFVEIAPSLPPADVVTLDRVICCYPDMPALVGASAAHAGVVWGAVFPRTSLPVRLGFRVMNLFQRLRGSAFRVYTHPTEGVERVLHAHGFRRRMHRRTLVWQVTVWRREGPGAS